MQRDKNAARKSSKFIGRLLIAVVACVLLVAVFTGLTIMTHTVTIHDGDKVYDLTTTDTDPMRILAKEKVVLGANDHFEFSGITDRRGDIYIIRSFEVTFTDGAAKAVPVIMTARTTVKELLTLMEVQLGEDDVLNCGMDNPLEAEMDVIITRTRYEDYDEEKKIPFVKDKPEEKLDLGATLEVKVEGQEGKKKTSYRKTFVNDKLVSTEVMADKVVIEPVTEEYIIKEPSFKTPDRVLNDPTFEVGRNGGSSGTTAVPVANETRYYEEGSSPVELDEDGVPLNYMYKVSGVASAYSNFGRPTKLAPGCVAMDQSRFPFGTRVYIRSTDGSYTYGYSKVADDGKAVNEGRVLVDCFFNTYQESADFGLKDVDIFVLTYPEEGEE